jgi:hypothetical protein
MTEVRIQLGGETFSVPIVPLVANSLMFQHNPALLTRPYAVQRRVSADNLRVFLSAMTGATPEITAANAADLALLCDEFGFTTLAQRVTQFRAAQSPIGQAVRRDFGAAQVDPAELQELRAAVVKLQNDSAAQKRQIALLQAASQQSTVARLEEDNARLQRLVTEHQTRIAALQSEISQLRDEPPQIQPKGPVERPAAKSVPAAKASPLLPSTRQFAPRGNSLEGIIACLSRECGGNVHDRGVVIVTCSKTSTDNLVDAAKNAADLRADSHFWSAHRNKSESIPHARNNWLCYDFQARRIVPTHYAIRSLYCGGVNRANLKSWLVELSSDGTNWTEIDRRENNPELNDRNVTRTFPVSKSKDGRFIRIVNIGRNHHGNDCLSISGFEVFGTLIDRAGCD